MELFLQIGILVILASTLAIILSNLKIPPIISYIFAGLFAGLIGLKPEASVINVFIELGIILLLFLAGLEIKLKSFLQLGKKTMIIGEGHDILMAIGGFLIAFFIMGLDSIASLYVAIGVTLSSTIVVIKALTSRKELAAPHGKILIGTMVLQDVVAMASLVIFSSLGTAASPLLGILFMFWRGLLVFIILLMLGRYIMPNVFYYAAKSPELIFLVALAWCFAGVGIAGFAGFSTAIGAFLAGLAIADLPFSFEIVDKAKGLQDFGILLFFLSVGLKLEITKSLFTSMDFYILSFYVIVFTPIVTGIIAGLLRFSKKENFIMSILPTQISEFTLILITFGLAAGHITSELYTLMTIVIVFTIIFSSVLIENLNVIYKKFEHKIDFLEWRHVKKTPGFGKDFKDHIVIFGFGPLGQKVAQFYKNLKKNVVVVDWRPELIKIAKSFNCIIFYGDAGDSDLWDEVRLDKASVVISTIGENQDDDLNLIRFLNKHNKSALKVMETNITKNAKQLYSKGADIVLVQDMLEWNDLKQYLQASSSKRRSLKKIFSVE